MSNTKDKPEHSGFEGPAIGEIIPENYIKIVREDGTIAFVPPDETSINKDKLFFI